jgi:poly(3-hydroxybutyrate) depolymerase
MTHKLRCVMADRITGMISYAAPMTFAIANDCQSTDPVSALVIQGTSDEVFPYSGQAGYSEGRITGTFSADQTIGLLAGLNGCRNQSEGADISVDNARNRVFSTQYPCDDTVSELYTITNLGHFGWAGTLPLKLDGKTVTLNQAIFAFISRVRDLS